MTTPNDSWVPTADEPLFILAMDHRASFGKDVFGIAGEWSPTDLTRMRQAKIIWPRFNNAQQMTDLVAYLNSVQ